MVKNVTKYFNSTVAALQEVRKSSAITNGPEGTVASKTVKSVQLVQTKLWQKLIQASRLSLTSV